MAASSAVLASAKEPVRPRVASQPPKTTRPIDISTRTMLAPAKASREQESMIGRASMQPSTRQAGNRFPGTGLRAKRLAVRIAERAGPRRKPLTGASHRRHAACLEGAQGWWRLTQCVMAEYLAIDHLGKE